MPIQRALQKAASRNEILRAWRWNTPRSSAKATRMQALNSIQSQGVPISCERERSPKFLDEDASRFPELGRRTLRLGGVQVVGFETHRGAGFHRDLLLAPQPPLH